MRGPKLKGYAEMAVIRRDASYVEQPGVFANGDESHSHKPDSYSKESDSHSDEYRFHSNDLYSPSTALQQSATVDSTSSNDIVQPRNEAANSLTVHLGGANQGASLQGGKYSPKLRQAFLGQSSRTSPPSSNRGERERIHSAPLSPSSPGSRDSCSSETGLLSGGHSDVTGGGVVSKEGRVYSRLQDNHKKSTARSRSSYLARKKPRGNLLFTRYSLGLRLVRQF